MKKILIIGANGKVGRKIVDQMLASTDMQPVALLRKESQVRHFEEKGVATRVASLEENVASLSNVMSGIDAVVFTAGSGPDTGLDKTLSVDLDGAVKTMEAALNEGIDHFVMISALGAGDRSAWETSKIKPYYIAKHYADRMLMQSGLTYTILRPGRLLDEPGSGSITLSDPGEKEGISREDVASLVLEILSGDHSSSQVVEFNKGEIPIGEALGQL